jgi:hypothetical protein
MGLGPIAGIDLMSLPAVRKTEQSPPRFEIESSKRAGDDQSSSQQQASERERKQDQGDHFQATAADDSDAAEAASQASDEGHDWFV